jgi:hypothetical protein
MPETPHYYLMRGKKVNALNSLRYLHENEREVLLELNEIQDLMDNHWTNESIEFEDIFKGHGSRKGEE